MFNFRFIFFYLALFQEKKNTGSIFNSKKKKLYAKLLKVHKNENFLQLYNNYKIENYDFSVSFTMVKVSGCV